MRSKEVLEQVKLYGNSLAWIRLSKLQRNIIRKAEQDYLYSFQDMKLYPLIHQDIDAFLSAERNFKALLPNHHEALCCYLQHVCEFTYTSGYYRIAARSGNLYDHRETLLNDIGAFYLFYGGNLNMESLIQGAYQGMFSISFAPVIAAAFYREDQAAIQCAKDVLLSENNTGILTRDLIIAIEMSKQEELQDILLQVFLAARLQEGLRQSIAETCDEYQYDFFVKTLHMIVKENLIRYSSIQRAVMTWCGLGYLEGNEKQAHHLLDRIECYVDHENTRMQALCSENPLDVYLALFVKGMQNVEAAQEEAMNCLAVKQHHIVASTIVYLKAIQNFNSSCHLSLFERFKEDPWIMALLYSSLTLDDGNVSFHNEEDAYAFMKQMESDVKDMKSEEKYTCKGFAWYEQRLSRSTIIRAMGQLARHYQSQKFYDCWIPFAPEALYGDSLKEFMEKDIVRGSREVQMRFLMKNIIANNENLQKLVKQNLVKMHLEDEEILELEERLKSKKSSARAQIVDVLAHQSSQRIKESYERLSKNSLQYRKDAAKELALRAGLQLSDEGVSEAVTYSMTDGLGLYDAQKTYAIKLADLSSVVPQIKTGLLRKKQMPDLSSFYVWDEKKMEEYIEKWSHRIQKHEVDEYYRYSDYVQLKDYFYKIDYDKKGLQAYPFADVWEKYFEEDDLTADEVFAVKLSILGVKDAVPLTKLLKGAYGIYTLPDRVRRLPYFDKIDDLITAHIEDRADSLHSVFLKKAEQLITVVVHMNHQDFFEDTDPLNRKSHRSITSLDTLSWLDSILAYDWQSDEEFKEVYPILFAYFDRYTRHTDNNIKWKYVLSALMVAKAIHFGMAEKSLLSEVILRSYTTREEHADYLRDNHLFESFRDAYFGGYKHYRRKPKRVKEYHDSRYRDSIEILYEVLDTIADRMLASECRRINATTDVSKYIGDLSVVYGAKRLVKVVKALGKEDFIRNGYGNDKRITLTNIVRCCYPLETDTAEILRESGISEERWVEVAMLSTQWIDMIDDLLGWDGFKEGCYYFIAHMKETNDDEKKAEIARFTDLDPADLRDGAFDMDWCREVYDKLGEKRFKLLYRASKFLCENAFHTRARKYADACLGNSQKEELWAKVCDKRNKDLLNAYAIVPLTDDRDLLERYTNIQQFAKESNQFGAQRRTSERRSAQIALMNLARNSRFKSEVRLTWMMESSMVKQYEAFLNPQSIEEYEVFIRIDDQGKNKLQVSKQGKKLAGIPAKIKKHPLMLEMQTVHNKWNEQYRRSKQMLEQAMAEQIAFSKEEIEVIMANPIVSSMMKNLVLKQDEQFGFYQEGRIHGLREDYELGNVITIAHPYDLYQAGLWHEVQKYVFDHKIVQPFKQVFRELYLKLDDELDQSISKRYSGYQIQVKKAAGALKSRKWNLDYESGMERIYYKQDLIVSLWADADWFSPSDIEAPSIDYVAFTRRKSYDSVKIKDIPPVIFSEIMRDLDMAISVAYVGGVDPITSFSTMELRSSIVSYTMELMKLSNVEVTDHFANIHGTLNDYSVHLGSGQVHQKLGGALHILPVHSSKRGKLYLPFLDEDPKTAEILSKIILLAEDHKIKDPSILSQIVRRPETY